jgi:hypothetical protein
MFRARQTQIFQKRNLIYAWFEVLTAMVMKSVVIWDITQCGPLKFNNDVSEERIVSIFRVVK